MKTNAQESVQLHPEENKVICDTVDKQGVKETIEHFESKPEVCDENQV